MPIAFTRRDFLKTSLSTASALSLAPLVVAEKPPRKKLRVAGITTVYRENSHSDVILGKLLEGYAQNGGPGPDLELVSLYVDQFPEGEYSRGLALKHGFLLAGSIDDAITLGTKKVAVDGVLSIGEHGQYGHHPVTKQRLYPRKRFFDEIVAALKRGGKMVPLFNDKHLAYDTKDAMDMYRTTQKLGIPFMAGSSVPVAWRIPKFVPPRDCEVEGAIVLGYGGRESYGFHTLEALQCLLEHRRGGETGVAAVRAVEGREILKTEKDGYWSQELFDSAYGSPAPDLSDDRLAKSAFYLIDYRDGLKATVAMLKLDGFSRRTCRLKLKGVDQLVGTRFTAHHHKPYRHFEWLVRALEEFIHTGKPCYPVERTVLTTGMINAAMLSLARGSERIPTPELDVRYAASDWPYAPGQPPTA